MNNDFPAFAKAVHQRPPNMHPREALNKAWGVATLKNIVPGAVLWHVYGFASREQKPEAIRLITGPVPLGVVMAHMDELLCPNAEINFSWLWFVGYHLDPYYPTHRSLNDCGIGDDYNCNRLFITESAAQDYIDNLNREENYYHDR